MGKCLLDFTSKTVLITGAATGIGRAAAVGSVARVPMLRSVTSMRERPKRWT